MDSKNPESEAHHFYRELNDRINARNKCGTHYTPYEDLLDRIVILTDALGKMSARLDALEKDNKELKDRLHEHKDRLTGQPT